MYVFNMAYDSLSPACPRHCEAHNIPLSAFLKEGYEIRQQLFGWCIAVKRSMFDKIGGFDTGVNFWFSDNLYADQLKYHGIKHALVCDSLVDHVESYTLKTSSKMKEYTWGQQQAYNKAKQRYAKK